MTVLVSDNGQNIVVIDDFAQGHIIDDRNALWFYNKGNLVKTHKLKTILEDTCNVSFSIWHTMRSLEDLTFSNADSTFRLSTYEFNDYVFDTISGNILSKKRPVEFDTIVFGQFDKGDSENVRMEVIKYVAGGSTEKIISFKTNYYGQGRWMVMIMLKSDVDVTPLRYRKSHISVSSCFK